MGKKEISGKPQYQMGVVAREVKKVIGGLPSNLFNVSEIIDAVHMTLPKAKLTTIRSTILGMRNREVIERLEMRGDYRRLPAFFQTPAERKANKVETVIADKDDGDGERTSYANIGHKVIALIEELKAALATSEEEVVRLTKQLNDLQDAYNRIKMNGTLDVKKIFD